jgi:hypothetical protein
MPGKLIHASCVAFNLSDCPAEVERERVFGVLLRGPSGAGKSDLALRLIDRGWHLVADDQTELQMIGKSLFATPPARIAGRIEVRGLGIVTMPNAALAELCLVVDLVGAAAVERLPEPLFCELLGVRLNCLALDPFALSAVAKLRLAALRQAGVIMRAAWPAEREG